MLALPLEIFSTHSKYDKIVSILKEGGTFIYPTETCYGLGCDATNSEAVEKIFKIKNRPKEKPCIVLFKDVFLLKQYAVLDSFTENLVQSYWPGALTVLLPVQSNTRLSPYIIPETNKISCRISPHPFIQKLFENFDSPLVSTSANLAGEPNIYDSKEIVKNFSSKEHAPDIFIDAGDLPFNPPSTLIEIRNEKIYVLRQGSIYLNC